MPLVYLDIPFHEPEQYLIALFQEEIAARQTKKIEKLIKKAGFPSAKFLEKFDWSPVTLPESNSKKEFTELAFIERQENILAVGAVGTGKTFLAVALGLKACTKGHAKKAKQSAFSAVLIWPIFCLKVTGRAV